jgi:hypothetical protein
LASACLYIIEVLSIIATSVLCHYHALIGGGKHLLHFFVAMLGLHLIDHGGIRLERHQVPDTVDLLDTERKSLINYEPLPKD